MWSLIVIQSCVLVFLAQSTAPPAAENALSVEESRSARSSEELEHHALDWIASLKSAESVELEHYVRETHLKSGGVLHQYARATYTDQGYTLEMWTPEQFDDGQWYVDDRRALVSDKPAAHTIELRDERVHETILIDYETGEREEYRYNRLDPLREEALSAIQRMAAAEAKESGVPADEWAGYIESRVSEMLPQILEEASSGVPISRARKYAPCLTGDSQGRYQGDGGAVDTLRKYIIMDEWLPEPEERNGLLCYGLVADRGGHVHTFWYNDEVGLVCWETTQFSTEAPDQPRIPEIIRERFYQFVVTPGDSSQASLR